MECSEGHATCSLDQHSLPWLQGLLEPKKTVVCCQRCDGEGRRLLERHVVRNSKHVAALEHDVLGQHSVFSATESSGLHRIADLAVSPLGTHVRNYPRSRSQIGHPGSNSDDLACSI